MNESCHIWTSHVTYEWVMSHMNKSCHIWTSHVTYEWVMSHMNESCHIWMSHVTYEWVMSHMNKSCHIWTSPCWGFFFLWRGKKIKNLQFPRLAIDEHSWVTHTRYLRVCLPLPLEYGWVMSPGMGESCPRVWVSHVPCMNALCPAYERVVSHVWISRVLYMNELCPTYGWVMSHKWMRHVPRIDESCPTYKRAMSHMWISYFKHISESYHAHPKSGKKEKAAEQRRIYCSSNKWVMSHI